MCLLNVRETQKIDLNPFKMGKTVHLNQETVTNNNNYQRKEI